jgi:translin
MVEKIVEKAAEELRLRDKATDEVMSRARRARILSKQAIQQVHSGAFGDVKEKLVNAASLIEEIGGHLIDRPELISFDTVTAAHQEYAEAKIIFSLTENSEFPDPEAMGVPITAYILGLADVPGELRRQTLDALRNDDLEAAESLLGTMERIYLSLIAMEEASLLKGLRRKTDIARGVIERTRSDVTAEAGRRRLNESVRRLTEKLD